MEKGREIGLAMEVRLFPTITATANQLAPSMQSRYANPIFPTPTMGGGGGERSAERARTGNLDFMARTNKWPTPRAFMHKDSTKDRGKHNLGEVVGGSLNPTWVEWLMGWPLGWTDLKPLAMDKFQEWQQQHSNF
jgi:hypothetical protein